MREVILGLPGPWADDNLEAADHYTTKIGGLPDWPFPESSLGPDFLQCGKCSSRVCLILQVYAPIYDSTIKIEERVIYVFGCTNSSCGSWHAIRVQKPEVVSEAAPSIVSSSPSDFKSLNDSYLFEAKSGDGDGDGDDDDDDIDMEELGRRLYDAAGLASKSDKEDVKKNAETNAKPVSLHLKTRKIDPTTLVLPCFYVYSQEDISQGSAAVSSSSPSLSVKEAQVCKDNNDPMQEETWEGECYEYDKALNADRTYLKFKKRLDKCPDQCFRYSFGGKPLLVNGDVSDPGTCGICGEPRHYEMQLISPLVYFLLERAINGQKDLLENWNWMTLFIYTCSKNCFQKVDHEMPDWNGWTVVQETVMAQFENPSSESSRLGFFS